MVLGLKPMGKLATSNKNKVLERVKDMHGPRTQTYEETSYFQKNKVLDRTKVLHGRWTQTYRETSNSQKNKVLDRTKVLHGPRTQTYGETRYFQKTLNTRQNQGLAWSSDSNLWGN